MKPGDVKQDEHQGQETTMSGDEKSDIICRYK